LVAETTRNINASGVAVKDALIAALGGDLRSGMCCCPAHDDGTPSLSVTEAANGKVLWHCFAGCSQAAVTDALRAKGLWPINAAAAAAGPVVKRRTDEERRQFALRILADTRANRGVELAEFLDKYFAGRGITSVPATAMLGVPFNTDPHLGERLVPDDPAMVFEVTDGQKIIGCHVTYLNGELTGKREEEPKRQFFGPVSGGFIVLYAGELDPKAKLIIAEGVETALAAAQLAGGLPAIAALSAHNLPKINPPPAREYIIGGDNDKPGIAGAKALAFKLKRSGSRVFITTPKVAGEDWNDVLQKGK
jgi:putative DNA primase/helicase